MDEEVRRLRAELAAAKRAGRMYPEALRQRVAGLARTRLRDGTSLWRTAQALGLGVQAVQRWLESAGPGFREVAVVEAPAGGGESGLVLVTAAGHRLTGLTPQQAVAVLRGLA